MMMMLGLQQQQQQQQQQGAAMPTAQNNTPEEEKNASVAAAGAIQMADIDLGGDDDDASTESAGRAALHQLEELLMEADCSPSSSNTKHIHSMSHDEAEMSLLKNTTKDDDGRDKQRRRTSSASSFSDMSFVTASQQHHHHHSQQQDDNESQASITSRADDGLEDLEAQHTQLLREQFLPAPGGSNGDGDQKSMARRKSHNLFHDRQQQQQQLEKEVIREKGETIPVISVSNVQVLAVKKLVPQEQDALVAAETRSTTTISSSSSSSSEDGHQSVASVQSLISVVAELISLPIRIFSAVLADLEHEIHMGHCRARAEFLSATVFKINNNANGPAGDNPYDQPVLPLGLQLDRDSSSGSGSLVISAIDPTGPWASTPFRVGDRIVSVNHVPVGDWEVEAVHEYWNTLEDSSSVTIVAHNPTGDAQWVEAMVTKPEPSSRTGLGMRSSRLGRVKISRVNGLFSNSLLNTGDQILSINGQPLDGCDSAMTAELILKSPRQVSLVARTDTRNAFVLSSTAVKNESTSNLLLAMEDSVVEGESINRQGESAHDQRRHVLNPYCGALRGPWTTLRMLHWLGNFYVLAILTAGLYFVFSNQAGLSLVMGVVVLAVVMTNMINVTMRALRQQVGKRHSRCSMFQISCTVIVIAAVVLLFMLWGHYETVTVEVIVSLVAIGVAPMLFFVNLPLLLPESLLEGETGVELEDDFNVEVVDGEQEAVASLAGAP